MTKYLYILPAMLMLAAVLIVPLVAAISMSFQQEITIDERKFVGFDNYLSVLKEPLFWKALKNTIVFTVASVAIHVLLGLVAALLLNQRTHGRVAFRIVALIPYMFSAVVVAGTWKWMLNAQFGVINDMLSRIGIQGLPWLGNVHLAMPAVVLANAWRGFPFIMVMSLAGLQAIPVEMYEASAIDGATHRQQLRMVILPQLRYILGVGVILDTIWTFKYFDLIQVMTYGGPAGATEVLVTLVFKNAFEYFNIGFAAALAVIVFVILIAFTTAYVRVLKTE